VGDDDDQGSDEEDEKIEHQEEPEGMSHIFQRYQLSHRHLMRSTVATTTNGIALAIAIAFLTSHMRVSLRGCRR
jgi:hypothetical protein